MPEGPSIVIFTEEAAAFAGRRVMAVEGNSREDIQRMRGHVLRAIRSWGKHILLEFDGFTLRIHLLLFGSYAINERRDRAPRLRLRFPRGQELDFYACSLKFIDAPLDEVYDWRVDVMSPQWSPRLASAKLRAHPEMLAADALLDQSIFSGVGNIIKNEVLHRIRVQPASKLGAMPARKRSEMVRQAREYSFEFLEWKRAHVLRKHLQVHAKTVCPRDGHRLRYTAHLGKAGRRAFWCDHCQRLYAD